ncbi:MAG: hypothetical protein HY815_16055 [Candidatus Riflebacteria bacterium]|nr:hypothetical protein [Candidatus Riflebacteria bacterium]
MDIEYKVQIELVGWENRSERELERLLEKHATNGEPDACDLEVDASIYTSRPSVITFTSTETQVDWASWLNKLLETARDITGTTCKASMTVQEIETTETYYRGEAAKLAEYEVLMPSIHKVRRRVTAKDQADAINRVKNGEGEVLGETDAPFESSKWSVTVCQPEPAPENAESVEEELPAAA